MQADAAAPSAGHDSHAGRTACRIACSSSTTTPTPPNCWAPLLEAEGHAVAVAHDGASGQRAAASFAPDVCILDIGLPDMTGHDLARLLSVQVPGCTFIALSGYGQPHDREQSLQAGFDQHLVKPVPLQELLDALAAARS